MTSATLRTSVASGLLARLSQLRAQVARLVESRSADDPTADDPLRGLYLSEEAVRHLLLRPGTQEPQDSTEERPGLSPVVDGDDPMARLADRLGLLALDVHILLAALAPDLDRSFEPLYGYLNDDVGRRRATTGLALDLCGIPVHEPAARARFHPSAPLTALGLLTVEEPERPFPSRQLSVPDRVVAHLLGDDTLDAALAGHIRPLAPRTPYAPAPSLSPSPPSSPSPSSSSATEFAVRLAALLTAKAPGDPRPPTVYLREHREGDGLACVTAALHTAGLDALHFSGPEDRVPDLLREARLSGRVVVVSPLPEQPAALVRALTGPNVSDVPVLLTGSGPYDPHWSEDDPLVLEAPRQGAGQLDVWGDALRRSPDQPHDLGFELAATVAPYRLGADRIARAARAAQGLAGFDGTPLTADHLRLAARQQSASGLERHARRIRPDVGWEDLVLPGKPLAQLRELALRARHRGQVLGDWRLSAGGGRGRGVLGLFAGESGTGKTLSAEVVAAELGLDLYVVQLSSVVDKYVGETAKNLERIFSEADRTDAVLLFDEADAVFGKRSEVKDAHDKYANMESAYLLQRLESFDGIALLTTNLRANIDEAFTRRLDLVVDFPFPDAGQRLALWQHSLARVPRAPGTDPARVADAFELAGGSIRSAVVTAAYSAAGRGEPVTAADLLEGAEREYRKAGRLVPGEGAW
ncbi:ATP-binding protein [Streptomyces sp. WI04-05B]|uniref:ATP-binding protein n=1 Tax=Streptomyces TaxID=1883 RepID=UPI0029B4BF6A|nr:MULTISPECIES: AAA family ATPase [unclassified Streptomyces]MDX2545334.1 AAA family ATPase [Streptomyces sp. WI04-05B]MDX2588171.1 AAA family ATPase [Streptomyces sp. WI04-05A]